MEYVPITIYSCVPTAHIECVMELQAAQIMYLQSRNWGCRVFLKSGDTIAAIETCDSIIAAGQDGQ